MLHSDKLRVRASCNNRSGLAVHHLPDGRRGEGQRAADLAGFALDFDFIAGLGRAVVGYVDVCGDTRLRGPVVPGGNGQAADPVNERGGDGAVNPAVGIDMVAGQAQARADDALGRMG